MLSFRRVWLRYQLEILTFIIVVVTSPWEGNISGQVDGNKCFVHPYDQSHLNCLSNMFSGLWQSCYTRSSSGSFVENCFLVILPRMQPSNETSPKTLKLCLRKPSIRRKHHSYRPGRWIFCEFIFVCLTVFWRPAIVVFVIHIVHEGSHLSLVSLKRMLQFRVCVAQVLLLPFLFDSTSCSRSLRAAMRLLRFFSGYPFPFSVFRDDTLQSMSRLRFMPKWPYGLLWECPIPTLLFTRHSI